jgi:hypothetical protein
MEGPDIVLSPRVGNIRRTVPENGIRILEFLPEILAYHRDKGTRALDLKRIYSFPTGRPDEVAVPPTEEDPTHVPFQVRDRSEGTPTLQTDGRESGVHGVEPITQVSAPAAPDAAHDSMVVHPRTPPPSPPMSPPSTISRGRSRPLLGAADTATGHAAWRDHTLSSSTPTYARGLDSTDFARTTGTVTATFAQSRATGTDAGTDPGASR